tara:strand:- start:431 stop:1360 length:930 start_codon:yes stop_codon:yes gene_type:complete
MKVLLIKTSSLGDVVHALPAVSDAVARGFEIDWMIEEGFSEIASMHPGVSSVIPVAWRRWSQSLVSSAHEIRAFKRKLRETKYDLCVDSQGLIKSGVLSLMSKSSIKAGYDYGSARESIVSFLYDKRVTVPRELHAIDRQRQLMSSVLDYSLVEEADSGIGIRGLAKRQAFLLHGTTWESKHWSTERWINLASLLGSEGFEVLITWGNPRERQEAEAIASKTASVVLARMSLKQLAFKLSESMVTVGVDTGLTHLSAAIGTSTIGLYGPTRIDLTGCRGPRAETISSRSGMAGISVETVWSRIQKIMKE